MPEHNSHVDGWHGQHCFTDDAQQFHANHPEGYGIELHSVVDGQYVVTDTNGDSFIEHIAVALRTLIDDGHIKPSSDAWITIYQDAERGDRIEWRASIDYTRASANACTVRLIT
jgi:hypothetical protein